MIHEVSAVEFGPDGLLVTYQRIPTDIRKNGLIWQHAVLVPHGSDYDDEIEELVASLRALLLDVLDDEDRAEPIELTEEQEQDDDDDDD